MPARSQPRLSRHQSSAEGQGFRFAGIALDRFLVELDGTCNKSRLGANAILSVSLAFARAQAQRQGSALYQYFAEVAGAEPRLPRPMINLFSGGKHAGQQTAIQDVQIVVPAATNISETLEIMSDVFRAAAQRAADTFDMRLLTADEGGLAPPFGSSRDMFVEAVAAIEAAGYTPGEDVALTVDVAASHFCDDEIYHIDGESLNRADMAQRIADWCRVFPIVSVEDGMDEADWLGWSAMSRTTGRQMS